MHGYDRDNDSISDIERNIERMMQQFMSQDKRFTMTRSRVWRPPTDVFETANHVVIKCELAGIQPSNVQISSDSNVVIISGARADVPHTDATSYHMMEILYGPFETRVPLPAPVRINEAKARYEDGFLKVLLPKSQSQAPGRIVVKFEF